jgi:hypothetical protein
MRRLRAELSPQAAAAGYEDAGHEDAGRYER